MPVFFIFLLAADVDFKKTDTTEEITPLVFAASSDIDDFQLPSESKIKIKRGDTFYSILINLGVDSVLINEIATDKQVKDFTKLKINDELFIEKLNDEIQIKKFDEDFYVDVLKVKGGEYVFEKEKEKFRSGCIF